MCKILEDMRREEREEALKEGEEKGLKDTALRMLAAGKYALEEIAAISSLSLDEVKTLQAKRLTPGI